MTLKEAKKEIERLNAVRRDGFFVHLEESERNALYRFQKKHMKCERGTIGGATTISFSPTSLGYVIQMSCHCGEKKDITDYSVW